MDKAETIARVGSYLLLHRLAQGERSDVFLALDLGSSEGQRLLVFKRLRPEHEQDPEQVARFLDQALVSARVQHPGIARIHDFGSLAGQSFVAQEYVQGAALSTLVSLLGERGVRFPLRAALHIGVKVATALHAAHTCTGPRDRPSPIVHRDVTLRNVLVSYQGEVKLVGFDLAQAESRFSVTVPGQLKGTLAYLTPEQLLGQPVGPATDVYQLGVQLYKLLVGREPIPGGADVDTMEKIVDGAVVPPHEVVAGFPAELEALLLQALHRDPAQRFDTAHSLAEALSAQLAAHGGFSAQQLAALLSTMTGERRALQQTFLRRLTDAHAQRPPRIQSATPAPRAPRQDLDQGVRALFPWARVGDEPAEFEVELSSPETEPTGD